MTFKEDEADMELLELHLLHGFLGTSKDWSYLDAIQNPKISLIKHEFTQDIKDFKDFAKDFNARVKAKTEPKKNSALLGYSLGGRLAMHVLIDSPHLYKGALFISSHFGLESEKEKIKRLRDDERLSKAFLHQDWRELMAMWNSKDVFHSKIGVCPKREEKDYKRKILSEILYTWSLGRQDYLLPKLAKLQKPLFFLTGEDDKKFTELYAQKSLPPKLKHLTVENSGHRIPFESKDFSLIIENLVKVFL
jgi:2-succinyl-6-hydroxy-2,4-cyclohexadiene-1-carboxylate synthase